jgi:hypothetical protein
MAVCRLIPAGDIELTGDTRSPAGGGSYVIVESIQQIRQRIAARFQFFAGEWFADLRQGIPYYREVFVRNPTGAAVRTLLRSVVLTTPGVLSCPRFDVTFDPSARRARALFEAICNGGRLVVTAQDNAFLLPQLPLSA